MGRAAKKIEWPLAMQILESLEAQGRKRELMMVALGLYSAFRASDWTKLKWGDITGDKIKAREQKTGKIREVAIGERLKQIIALCRENAHDDDFIFKPLRGGTGKTLATGGVIKRLRAIGLEHGIPDLSSHSLRKSAAWRIYEQNGKDDHALTILGMMLNHTSTATTRIYLGITMDEINDIYLKL